MLMKEKIKEQRLKKGLTQKQLAEFLNIPLSTLKNYEQGLRASDYKTLKKFKEFFDCSYDDLIE